MRERLANYIRSGHPGLYILSAEETRVEAELALVAAELEFGLYTWSVSSGLVDTAEGGSRAAEDPLDVLDAAAELPENTIVLLKDFHVFFEEGNPMLVRTFKEVLAAGKATGRCLVLCGCRRVLPPEIEREIVVVEFALPGREAIEAVMEAIADSAGIDKPQGDDRDRLVDAAGGMTTVEAENALALSVVEAGGLSPAVVAREKAEAVAKNGLLEIVEVRDTLADIGGLDVLKGWLLKRREAFSRRAAEYGLPGPRGLLILGIPGTGKSLTAKATAGVFGRPLLKLDAGRLYGGLVGESESNLRSAIRTAEAIAPSILWVDEIEKGFGGGEGSASTDGGTSARIFGSFLSWMQEKTAPVFVVATANDVSRLPPELLRRGRFDENFFVDLPNAAEREAIWRIQIARHGRDPQRYDLAALSKASEGCTGAEIEQVVVDALYSAFPAQREPNEADMALALSETVPLSRLMAERIAELRRWARGRTRAATTVKAERGGRKITADCG